VVGLLDALIADYEAWEKERRLPGGLFWQYDVADGMEESISGSRHHRNARPTINSYMYGNARALSRIARLAGRAAAAEWAGSWAEALRTLYPGGWTEPAGRVGAGIRALMESEGDLREALEVSRAGLLASLPTSVDEFRVVARNGSCWTPSSRSRTPPVAPLRASDDVRHHRDLPVFVVLGDVELPADPSRRAQACRLAGAEPVMARLPGCRGGRCAHLYATQAGFHS